MVCRSPEYRDKAGANHPWLNAVIALTDSPPLVTWRGHYGASAGMHQPSQGEPPKKLKYNSIPVHGEYCLQMAVVCWCCW